MLRFSKNTRFLFFCILAIFCFYQVTAAQSGRRIKKNDASTEQKPTTESKPTETKNETQKNETPVRISSLVVVGEVQRNFSYYSNEIDIALKECVGSLKSLSRTVTRGSGKTDYDEAKKRAEKETDTFVLWLGFVAKVDGNGYMYIESVQYAVLTPKTAKVVTRGEVEPETEIVTPGGVLQIPTTRHRLSALSQMKQGARKIAAILLRGGWFD